MINGFISLIVIFDIQQGQFMNRYFSAMILLYSALCSAQAAATTWVPIKNGGITIFIPVDDPPEAAFDIITVDEDSTTELGAILLSNDVDEDIANTQITITSPLDLNTLNGTLTQNGNILTYTPATNEWGETYDSFNYYLTDIEGNTSEIVTVTINVNSVNDRPVHTPPPPPYNYEERYVVEDSGWSTYNGLIGVSDADGDALYLSQVTATHGSVSVIEPERHHFDYRPAPDFKGVDDVFVFVTDGTDIIQIYYRVVVSNTPDPLVINRKVETGSDGQTRVTITAIDPDGWPQSLYAEVTGPVTKTSQIQTTCFNHLPPHGCQYDWNLGVLPTGNYTLNVHGTDSDNVPFAYVANADTLATETASNSGSGFNFVIGGGNVAPVAINDSYSLKGDGQQYTYNVTLNDSDPNTDVISLSGIINSPAHGSAEIVDGKLRYTPNRTDTFVSDSLVYQITDGKGGLGSASVIFDILPEPVISPTMDLSMQVNGTTGLRTALIKTGTQVSFSWTRPNTSHPNVNYCLKEVGADNGHSTSSTSTPTCLATSSDTQLDYVFNTNTEHNLIVQSCLLNSPNCSISNTVIVRTTNMALQGLTASASEIFAGNPVTLSWNASIASDVQYLIEVDRPEPQSEQTANWERLEQHRRYTDTQRQGTLNLLGTYRFRVTACSDSLGCGAPSAPVSVLVEEFVMPAVETLNIALTSEAYVLNVNWSPVNINGASYTLQVNTPTAAAGTWQSISLTSASATSNSYTATDGDGNYTFRVAACLGSSECSVWRERTFNVDGSVLSSSRRVMFIHTDALGSPAAETDESGAQQ